MFRSLLTAAAITLCFAVQVTAEQTPPIMPKVQETPLDPPVTLTAPKDRPADVPNRPLTADEAARIALAHQPGVTIAKTVVTASHGRLKATRSGLLPNLNVTGNYTDQAYSSVEKVDNTPTGGPILNKWQTSATLRQLIFDFNHTRDLVSQADAAQQSALANLTRVQSDLVLQVKQAFYIYSQNVRLTAVNEANVHNQQNHLALAQARLKAGMGLPADVVRAETAVAEASLALNIARTNESTSRVDLAGLMGIDPRTPIDVADTQEPVLAANDLNALVDQAIKQRPELTQAHANISSARYGVRAAKTDNAPSFVANLGLVQRGSSFPPGDDTLTYGVALNWTPFDSGLTKGRVEEAQANLQASQAQMDSTRLGVLTDVSQAYLNLKTAEQRVTTANAEVANAEEAVRLTTGRYSSGLGTFLDVLDAQTALLTANTNCVNAVSSVNQARAALSHAIGVPITGPHS